MKQRHVHYEISWEPASAMGYQFSNTSLLQEALTHSSFSNESGKAHKNYQRLEFLGDAVVELIVSEYLISEYPKEPEGFLTKRRAGIVQAKSLAWWAEKIGCQPHIRFGKGEGKSIRPAILADIMEAICGAIFLDAGYSVTKELLLPWIAQLDLQTSKRVIDYKTTLQELVQSEGRGTPVYHTVNKQGPDHDPQYTVDIVIEDQVIASGVGNSVKMAGIEAAKNALQDLGFDRVVG